MMVLLSPTRDETMGYRYDLTAFYVLYEYWIDLYVHLS